MGKRVEDIFGISEMKESRGAFVKAIIGEWLGTLLLVFFGCGSAVVASRLENGLTSAFIVHVSLTFGLIVAAMAQAIGHISGCHINPAVTIGIMVTGQMSVLRGLIYMVAQYVGALVGAALLSVIVSDDSFKGSLGANGLQAGVLPVQGFIVEFMVTFILVLVVFGCCDARRDDVKGSIPLAIGLTVTLSHLLSIGFTGAGLNPARTFGPLIIGGKYNPDYDWVYFVGPYLGGSVAGLVYNFVFKAQNPNDAGDF